MQLPLNLPIATIEEEGVVICERRLRRHSIGVYAAVVPDKDGIITDILSASMNKHKVRSIMLNRAGQGLYSYLILKTGSKTWMRVHLDTVV